MDSGTSNLLGAGPGEQYLLSNLMIDLTDERQLWLRLLRLQLRGLLHGPTAVERGFQQGPTPPPLTFFNSPAVSPFLDRKSTRLNSSHGSISYAVFFLIKN